MVVLEVEVVVLVVVFVVVVVVLLVIGCGCGGVGGRICYLLHNDLIVSCERAALW